MSIIIITKGCDPLHPRVGFVEDTDGLHVVSAPVGPRYPMGLLVVQDGINVAPDARVNQNFKLVSWQDVLDALNLAVPEGPERE